MIKIYATPEDDIVVEGDVTATFDATAEQHFVSLSDASVVKLSFKDNLWEIEVVAGTPDFSIEQTEGLDTIVLYDAYDWVMFGDSFIERT
jgi:hypothetical protein